MTLVEYAKQFIGRPYIWGGDGSGKTYGGFDCSGFVLECLWALGVYEGKDTTSQGLFEWCKENAKIYKGVNVGEAACTLLFFGKDKRHVTHVSISIGDGFMIEAGGGGSKCKNFETSTGMVRIRPIENRSDFLAEFSLV